MPFDGKTGKEAGKISKRSSALPMDLRSGLHQLVNNILNDLDYNTLNENQKLKLLDICLKHCLPKLSIEKSIGIEDDMPKEFEIAFVNNDGEVIETVKNTDAFKRDKID